MTIARYPLPDPPAGTQFPEHLDFERSSEGLAAINVNAGYTVLNAQLLCWDWCVSWKDYWYGLEAGIGAVGATYLSCPPHIRQDMAEILTPYRGSDNMLVFPCQAALVCARP